MLSTWRLRFIRAFAALGVTVASFVTVYAGGRWCGARADPAIMAAIVTIGLMRHARQPSRAHVLWAPFALAAIALIAAGVGFLFRANLVCGAIAFTIAMFASIWLRNFGETARSAGALIALPLVAMLVVPVRAAAPGGPIVDLALLISAGIVPLGYATLVQWSARRAGVSLVTAEAGSAETRERRPRAGPSPATRMALQMSVALAAAFVVGFVAFPGHWAWAVLTAFIVCSGARGRGEAVYKAVLRLVGALTGTLVAAAIVHMQTPSDGAEAVTIFSVLFFGLLLRDVNYAYWAACMTVIFALLAGSNDAPTIGLLGVRLEAILAEALCGVAGTWFVFPIRTEAVIRRRLADALSALDELIQSHVSLAERSAKLALFEQRIEELDRVAPPVLWHRRIFARAASPEHPARWIEQTHQICHYARTLGARIDCDQAQAGAVRRAIGSSRRAIANHGKTEPLEGVLAISAALSKLHAALEDAIAQRH